MENSTYTLALVPCRPLVVLYRVEAVNLDVGEVGAAEKEGAREAAGGGDVLRLAGVDGSVSLA